MPPPRRHRPSLTCGLERVAERGTRAKSRSLFRRSLMRRVHLRKRSRWAARTAHTASGRSRRRVRIAASPSRALDCHDSRLGDRTVQHHTHVHYLGSLIVIGTVCDLNPRAGFPHSPGHRNVDPHPCRLRTKSQSPSHSRGSSKCDAEPVPAERSSPALRRTRPPSPREGKGPNHVISYPSPSIKVVTLPPLLPLRSYTGRFSF